MIRNRGNSGTKITFPIQLEIIWIKCWDKSWKIDSWSLKQFSLNKVSLNLRNIWFMKTTETQGDNSENIWLRGGALVNNFIGDLILIVSIKQTN